MQKIESSPQIEKLTLINKIGDSVDLFYMFTSIVIYEDIYSPVLSG